MAACALKAAPLRCNVVQLPRPLRRDVPSFDPKDQAHLRLWEAMWDFFQASVERHEREASHAA